MSSGEGPGHWRFQKTRAGLGSGMEEKANVYFVFTLLNTILNMLSFEHQHKTCKEGPMISFQG